MSSIDNASDNKIKNQIDKILGVLSSKTDIMAVIKYAAADDVISVIRDGRIKMMGENRVQDAIKRWNSEKFKNFRDSVDLHFIGHLQKNKIKYAVGFFNSIDSVDSSDLAFEINLRAEKTGLKVPVMIQLKINERDTQYGIMPDNFDDEFKKINDMKHLSLRGIMAIGPITQNTEEIRNSFRKAKNIYDKYFKTTHNTDGYKNYLSMGMSSDWKIAILEGSNLIRIGSYLFNTTNDRGQL
ncbi:MAG: YggS family pyridoxal phosphate-dependent enzyme [Elusimicrobiales bacterium]|nr:YggS family pyridoxal phosphate-dependent enzyme [Elusimicrobiales bacterium]